MADALPAQDRELVGQPTPPREAATGDLVRQLAAETGVLVRQEIELAKAELAKKARNAGVGVGGLSLAGFLAVCAVGTLTATAILALSLAVPAWGAALIVTAVYVAAAAASALIGARRLKQGVPPVPEQTVETVKDDVEWAKTRLRSARR